MNYRLLEDRLMKYDENISLTISSTKVNAPEYSPKSHVNDIANEEYYKTLIVLRNALKLMTDFFFTFDEDAFCIDLFMYTPSISSPMGSGSDSEPIPFRFGMLNTFLVDSSQFGFEPILINDFKKVYCYLPSLRGEAPDKRHLNQFYHCEIELIGGLDDIISTGERYFKFLAKYLLKMPELINKISRDSNITINQLEAITSSNESPRVTFDQAIKILEGNNLDGLIKYNSNGNDLTSEGEVKIGELLNYSTPFWIVNYDRDRAPFYQKPDPSNPNKVLCADLIVPELFTGCFGGEVLGAGQRQDNRKEMLESLQRQEVDKTPYEWYIDLRNTPKYQTTSGFGMGIERFISWIVGLENIRDAIIFPRIRNVKTYP